MNSLSDFEVGRPTSSSHSSPPPRDSPFNLCPILHSILCDNGKELLRLVSPHPENIVLDIDGFTILHMAAKHGYVDVIRSLTAAGANVDHPAKALQPYGSQEAHLGTFVWKGSTQFFPNRDLHSSTPLHEAAATDQSDAASELIQAGANVNATTALLGSTALHVAIAKRSLSVIKLLLSKGANVNASDFNGLTPLHQSILQRDILTFKQLLKIGADPLAQTNGKSTALHFAVQESCLDIAQELLQNSLLDVNAVDAAGFTPLHRASIGKDFDMCRLLVESGADADVATTTKGMTAFHLSVGGLGVIPLFLKKRGANPEVKDSVGLTPLHCAVKLGRVLDTYSLVAAGADINAVACSTSETPLHFAVRGAFQELVELLLRKGADCNAYDAAGNTPFHIALKKMEPKVIQLMLDSGASRSLCTKSQDFSPLHYVALRAMHHLTEVLLAAGADANEVSASWMTPLHCAVLSQSTEVVKTLIENGASVSETLDSTRYTPLHLATLTGSTEIAHILLSKGSSVHDKDHRGSTPLHYAAWRGHSKLVSLLLEGEADPDVRDYFGYTPSAAACEGGHLDLALLISLWGKHSSHEARYSPITIVTPCGSLTM